MSEERFDVIVVGAGLAGSAAAYTLAKAGKSVLVIERGDSAGSKNVSGGRIYTYALEQVEPGFTAQAALERCVTHEQIMLLDEQRRALTMDYGNPAFGEGVPQSYTVLRAVFDRWFAEQVEDQGAFVASGIKVDDLVIEDGRVAGIVAGDDPMLADVVIAADGVNSLLAQKAGLRPDLTPHHIGVGVKEIIELPPATIEARFNLQPGEGAARMILGGTQGVKGGGFLYTNTDSISLGCVFLPESLAETKVSIHELFQQLKLHPAIQPLIEGGKTVEYGAHLVPEAGWHGVPECLYQDGLLLVGDAAGFVMNQGYTIRGMDLAILSGLAAAKAILEASGFPAVGTAYVQQLKTLGLEATMQRFEDFPALMDNERLFTTYPAMAADVFNQLFDINGNVPDPVFKSVLGAVRHNSSWLELARDGWQMFRTLQ